MIKNVTVVELNISIVTTFLNTQIWNGMEYNVYVVTKFSNKFYEKLKERFLNKCKHSNQDNNKFALFL